MDLSSLKKARPSKLVAHLEDGEERVISLPTGKAGKNVQWGTLESILEALNWELLEGFNEQNEVIYSLSQSSDSQDLIPRPDIFEPSREGELLKLLTEAQKMVLAETRESTKVLVDGYSQFIGLITDRIDHIEDKYMNLLELIERSMQENAEIRREVVESAESSIKSDSPVMTIISKLIENVPPDMISGLLGSGNNGVE